MDERLAELLRKLYGLANYDNLRTATEVASMVPTPIVSDVASGLLAVDDLRKGNYGDAALNAVGLLPFVPGMAGIFKPKGKLLEKIVKEGFDPDMAMSHGMKGELDGGWFNEKHYGKSDSGYAGRGTYGTQLDTIADAYSRGGEGANVVPMIPKKGRYVDIASAKGDENPYLWINEQVQAAMKRGEYWKEAQENASKQWTEMMKERGYLGAVDKENGKITQAVIFDSENIRSPFSFK